VAAGVVVRAGGRRRKKLRRASLRRQWETIDEVLLDWLESEEDDEDDLEDDEFEEDFSERLIRPEVSLRLFRLFLAFDGKHLPWPGGLLDQPDWWLHDANILSARKAQIKRKWKRERGSMERVRKRKEILEQMKLARKQ
jgi:hypothetical protein